MCFYTACIVRSFCTVCRLTHVPFSFHQNQQASAQVIVQELAESLDKIDVATLSFQCGRDYEPLVTSLDTMMAILNSLEKSAASGLSLLSCERIIPIYTEVVYDGTCNYSVSGFTWMFSSLLIISAMGMIMIMLRSSYQNNRMLANENDPTDEDSEFNNMNDLTKGRRRSSGNVDAYDLQLQEHQRYREQAGLEQNTSDSGSVYTDGNGDLQVFEVDPSKIPHNLYDVAPSYDSRGRPKPTAPVESFY